MKHHFLCICATLAIGSCGPKPQQPHQLQLRSMNQQEAIADFDQLVANVEAFYGPLEYKLKRFGINFEEHVATHRQAILDASGDLEVYGVMRRFLAAFHDGHVGLGTPEPLTGAVRYQIDLFVTPLFDPSSGEKKTYVAKLSPDLAAMGIGLWDEVVSVDGKKPLDYLPDITSYTSIGYDGSNEHLVYQVFYRPSYIKEMVPISNRARVVIKKRDGRTWTLDPVWKVVKHTETAFVSDGSLDLYVDHARYINQFAKSTIAEIGATNPVFATPVVMKRFDIQKVSANQHMLAKYGFKPTDKIPPIFAGLYEYRGKNILLIRNEGYHHSKERDGFSNEDYMKHYRALLDQWDRFTDVLVVDQTRNPGGSYCSDFFSLFISNEQPGFVQANNADRRWIRTLTNWTSFVPWRHREVHQLELNFLEMAEQVEQAIDDDRPLSSHVPLFGYNKVKPDQYNWKKPVLVLVDELAGSCGDIFPMLMKHNGIAKLFGHRTMGLGGNVETVAQLRNSGAWLRLTRGLFTTYREDKTYEETGYAENNGVPVDHPYEHTIHDVRRGFTGYVQAFSDRAVAIISELPQTN